MIILLTFITACVFPSLAEAPASPPQKDPAIAVLFTNDVHCYYDSDIGYDGLMLYKKELEQRYARVVLVDAGDAIQGAPLGAISGGEEPIRLMNAVGYDVATIGNHEFDYGFDVLDGLQEELDCGYICANFCTAGGEAVYAPYSIMELDGTQVAFIGADTPDTFSKTVIHDITDDTGVPMYDFKADASGASLCACLQGYIDEVRGQGADFVILVAHLGNGDDATEVFKSPEVIARLRGLSAVIDAHSHQVYNTTAPDADGVPVPLVQTGSYFKNVGLMLLDPDGTISVDLVSEIPAPEAWMEGIDAVEVTRGDCSRWVDADMHRLMEEITESYASVMNRKVGELAYDLIVRNDSGADISRNHENGLCELVADAYREISGADVSVINAGSVRNNLSAGEVTFNDVLNVLPYSNDIVIARLSGQTLLDMLEFSCRAMPVISPGFPQVSGIEFTVDIGTESTVETDENGDFLGVAGAYRVRDVRVGGSPLNPERQYTIATTSFLLGGGDHFKMLADHAEVIGTTQKADNILLAEYIEKNLNGQIPSDYRQGGRIREIQTFEDGWREYIGGVKVANLSGTWREMGRQYGALMRSELDEVHTFVESIIEYNEGNASKADSIIAAQTRQTPWRIAQFFEGAAETSGLTVEQLQAVNAVERIGGFPHCSVAMAWGDYASDALVVGRNYDYSDAFALLKDDVAVTVYHPADGALATATIGYVGEIYAVNGLNEAGLFLELNNGKPSADIKSPDVRITGTTLLFEVLFEADSLDDLDIFFDTMNCSSSHIINVADENEGRSYEWCPIGVKDGGGDLPEGLLVSTNYFINPNWLFKTPTDAGSWQGLTRRANLISLCEDSKGAIDEERMMRIIETPIEDGGAMNDLTVYQMVVVPRDLTLWLRVVGGTDWVRIDMARFLNAQ